MLLDELISAGEVTALVARDTDRLIRNDMARATLEELLKASRTDLYLCSKGGRLDLTQEMLTWRVQGLIAAVERTAIVSRTESGWVQAPVGVGDLHPRGLRATLRARSPGRLARAGEGTRRQVPAEPHPHPHHPDEPDLRHRRVHRALARKQGDRDTGQARSADPARAVPAQSRATGAQPRAEQRGACRLLRPELDPRAPWHLHGPKGSPEGEAEPEGACAAAGISVKDAHPSTATIHAHQSAASAT